MRRMFVLPLLAVILAEPAAAGMPEIGVAGAAKACTVAIAGDERPCLNYFYMTTADGDARIFILATPHGVAFTGSSEQPATDNRYVFSVDFVRREEGDTAKDYNASGECVVTMSGTGKRRSISMECSADSDIGHATLRLADEDVLVSVD